MHLNSPLHSSGGVDESAPIGSTLTIGEVSTLLGVPAPTIRSWERRHGLPTGARDEQGRRRYTAEAVAVLRRMRDQRAIGVRVEAAAATAAAASPMEMCLQLLNAVDVLDSPAASAVLDASLTAHGLPVTIDEVLLPSMREVGDRWSRGQCDIAQEHLATGVVRSWLARQALQAPPALHPQPIVLSCGPRDHHTISLEAFSALLREERFDCLVLGAQTPAESLRRAVEQSAASAVVLVSQLPRNRAHAVSSLHAVRDSGAALFYAGAAFRTAASRQNLPGHYLGGNLSQAAKHITRHLQHS